MHLLFAPVVFNAYKKEKNGAWTPPWLDNKFKQFINGMGIPYETVNYPERKWDPDHISFSDQINYLMA
jgi:hypothetical protein